MNSIDSQTAPEPAKPLYAACSAATHTGPRSSEPQSAGSAPGDCPAVEAAPTRKRRLIAFLIDLAILGVIWATIDNTLTVWLPAAIINLLEAALFCLYFWLTEGRSSRHASLGKRWLGIRVATHEGSTPSQRAALFRSLVLAAMVTFDWTSLLVPIPAVPYLAILLASAIPGGFVLYNLWIGIKDPNQPLVQDFLTGTRVQKADVSVTVGTSDAGATRWPYRQALVPALILSVGGAIDREQDLLAPSLYSSGEQISNSVSDELGLRTRVSVAAEIAHEVPGDAAKATRNLSVSVWIPALSWTAADLGRVVKVVVSNLDVDRRAFDTLQLTIQTGKEGFVFVIGSGPLSRWSALVLNVPTLADEDLAHAPFVSGTVYWRLSAREGISDEEERAYEDKAIAEYRDAIREDPGFALAHLGLASISA